MNPTWHEYHCEKGCGHRTIIDKHYKTKVVFCGVCGTKTTMEYQGERLVENAPKAPFKFGESTTKTAQYSPFKK